MAGPVPQNPSDSRSRGIIFLAGATIAAAAAAVYHDSLSGEFVFDDLPAIVDNPTIRHLWNLGSALSPPAGGVTVSGRPLLNLSFAINYAISGTDVWSYHAANLLIHILAALTLFGIVRRTLRNTAIAFAVALIWTVHPLQTESVAYIAQRAESLMALFYLLTLYCFIRSVDFLEVGRRAPATPSSPSELRTEGVAGARRPTLFLLLSFVACLLGMATKEVMVSAPLIIFLYDRTFVSGSFRQAWRTRRQYYIGLACTWFLLAVLVAGTGGRGGTAGFGSAISWPAYGVTQFRAIAHYLRLSFWPHPLIFFYGPTVGGSPGELAVNAAVVLGLVAATWWALFRPVPKESGWDGAQALGFAGAWFFAILAPSSSVVPVATETIAEHRMYLALAPVIAVGVVGAYSLLRRLLRTPALFAAVAAAVLLAVATTWGCLTASRNEDYRSDLSLWTVTEAAYPQNAIAQYNLGVYLVKAGQRAAAIEHYREAVRLKPDYIEAHTNLGIALSAIGHVPEAMAEYEAALELNPDYPKAHYNLGLALFREGRLPDAIAEYEEALRLKPDYPQADLNAGDALADAGRVPEAIAHYEKAMRLDPDDADVHNNLGIVLVRAGRVPEAIAQFERALQLQPNHKAARRNLADLLARLRAP